jgi:glycerol 3-phosphatase-2
LSTVALVDQYDLVIFDLDGVLYLGTHPVPGAVDAMKRLRSHRIEVAYVTNNASRDADAVAELLTSIGVPAKGSEVTTSAQAAAAELARRLPAGGAVLVVGAPALAAEVSAVGLRPSDTADQVVAVVQGFGPQVGWAQLAEACVAVRSGTTWVATNTDRTVPSPRGPLPGNGALVEVVAMSAGRRPDLVVGKPAPTLFHETAARHNSQHPVVVGDRLDTDIEGANNAGMDSLLVLTGVTRPADLLAAAPRQRPTFVATDLSGLFTVDDAVRIAEADGLGGWRVDRSQSGLLLAGEGNPIDALRALCAAAWSGEATTALKVVAADPGAQRALEALGLTG